MSQVDYDLFGFHIDNLNYNMRDNRMDNLISRHSGDNGYKGIGYNRSSNGLYLVNGGYFEDGAAFEDVPQSEATVSSNSFTERNTPQAGDYEIEHILNGGSCQFWMVGSTYLSKAAVDEDFEIDITGHFELQNGTYLFVPDSNYPNNLESIAFNENDNEIIITFDSRAVDEIRYTECVLYTINSNPQVFDAELVYSTNLGDMIAQYLIDNGYIQSPM